MNKLVKGFFIVLISSVLMFSVLSTTTAAVNTDKDTTDDNVKITYKKKTVEVVLTLDANGGYFVPATSPKKSDISTREQYIINKNITKYSVTLDSDVVHNMENYRVFKSTNIYRPDYHINGWYTKPSGGEKINPKSVNISKNTTYFAQWRNAYNLTLDPNGGDIGSLLNFTNYEIVYLNITNATVAFNYTSFETLIVIGIPENQTLTPFVDPVTKPTRPGYGFLGWSTSKAGGSIINPSTFKLTKNTVLYPQWTKVKLNLTFDANGGSVKTPRKQLTTETPLGTLPTPTRTGFLFKGWTTSKTGGTQVKSTTKMPAKNTVLYAQWTKTGSQSTKNMLNLTLDPNGGSVKIPVKKLAPKASYGSLTTPTRIGYDFKGWFTSKTGGTQVQSTTKMSAKNTVVYAQWTKAILKLTLNPNGGTVKNSLKKLAFQNSYGSLATPTRPGHIFKGWFTSPTGGSKVNSTTKMSSKNTVIYAQWMKDPINVTDLKSNLIGTWKRPDGAEYIFNSNGKVTWYYDRVNDPDDYIYTGNWRVLSTNEMLTPNQLPELSITSRTEYREDGTVNNLRDVVYKFSISSDKIYLNIAPLDEEKSGKLANPLPTANVNEMYKKA